MRLPGLLLACLLSPPAFAGPAVAGDVSESGFICRQATDFLEFCGETQGDDFRGWRSADFAPAAWWYPSDPEILARIEAIPAKQVLKPEDARKRVQELPFLDVKILEQLETTSDWVIDRDAETIVNKVDSGKGLWIQSVTWFQLNDTLVRAETLWPKQETSPQYRQAHAAFLWAIRFKESEE